MHREIIIILVVLTGLGLAYSFYTPKTQEPQISHSGTPITTNSDASETETLLTNLDIPWEIAFLPDDTLFITERGGVVWQLSGAEKKQILALEDVAHVGEGGLLGMAHHPNHARNGYTYLYYTYRDQGELKNKVVRYSHIGDTLRQDRVIIDNIPGNANHNGGRIAFGPDGKLYVTTGDSQNPSTSQDINSLAGKILRLNDDGSIPSDNPFDNSPVYSYGHRNPQGLAWDPSGKLWATEHGQSAMDEVNVIYPGKNYGWPDIRGDQEKDGMEKPILHSGNSTWAPSGATISGDTLYFTGLRGGAIFALDIKQDITLVFKEKELKTLLRNSFGRIRSIIEGPDGSFYIITSNRDGRGSPKAEDDRLIRIPAKNLD